MVSQRFATANAVRNVTIHVRSVKRFSIAARRFSYPATSSAARKALSTLPGSSNASCKAPSRRLMIRSLSRLSDGPMPAAWGPGGKISRSAAVRWPDGGGRTRAPFPEITPLDRRTAHASPVWVTEIHAGDASWSDLPFYTQAPIIGEGLDGGRLRLIVTGISRLLRYQNKSFTYGSIPDTTEGFQERLLIAIQNHAEDSAQAFDVRH